MKVNILLNNNFFNDHCTYGFVYPIIKSFKVLKEKGINLNLLYSENKNIFDCDTLIIDSRFIGKLKKSNFINFLNKNKSKELNLIFVDTADNSGQLKVDFLKIVDQYWKGQILHNKKEYMESHYGGRLFTDYYNKKFNIKDKSEQYSKPIVNKNLLKKIKVCWNMGLCDHGKFAHIKQKIFSILKSKILINNTNKSFLPILKRNFNLSCRISTDYERETVRFQRKRISLMLKSYTQVSKMSRFKYLKEMSKTRCVISPFGWGELCPRDFEAFIYGSILIKPDMKTISTWPNWYIPNQTYIPFKWDMSNFINQINYAINNYKKLIQIAIKAQEKYFMYTVGKKSEEIFDERFIKLIKN